MRTVDNLGLEASRRYAKDKELLDTRFIEESRIIPQKAQTTVWRPYLPSEFSQRFQQFNRTIWALFYPPSGILEEGRQLFSYQVIPSLGGSTKQEADLEKLQAWKRKKKKGDSQRDNKGDNQEEPEEKEQKTLIALLQCIALLDRDLALVNSRRNQYQKG